MGGLGPSSIQREMKQPCPCRTDKPVQADGGVSLVQAAAKLSSGRLSWGSRSLSSVLSVTTRCCCEIRREAATGGSHARSFDISAGLPADTFWRSARMDVSPDLTRKRCASVHVHVRTCHVLPQLFAERGRMLGLIFRPRLRFLSRGAVLNVRALFGKTNANTFSVLSGCKTTTGGLNGCFQVRPDRGSRTSGHLASQPLFEDTGGGDHRRFSPL